MKSNLLAFNTTFSIHTILCSPVSQKRLQTPKYHLKKVIKITALRHINRFTVRADNDVLRNSFVCYFTFIKENIIFNAWFLKIETYFCTSKDHFTFHNWCGFRSRTFFYSYWCKLILILTCYMARYWKVLLSITLFFSTFSTF